MSSNNTNGASALTLLGIAFIVLKLCKVITWSWWWVTVPFWGGFAIAIPLLFWLYKLEKKEKRQTEVRREEKRMGLPVKKSAFAQRLEDAQKKQEEQRRNRLK